MSSTRTRIAEPSPPPGSDVVRTEAHELRLLPDMAATIEALGADIGRASRRVWIESYICRDDAAGQALVDCMAAARARGAEVRLLYDPLGCRDTPADFFAAAARRGIAVRAYRPQGFAPFGRHLGIRDHARSALLDDVAYTGGANFGREWLPRDRGGDGWHDVCVRVTGPCVRDAARAAELRWEEADGSIAPRDLSTADLHRDVEWVSDAPRGDALVLRRLLDAFGSARARIWLENAYCLPPPVMLAALTAAARRGVDVRLILPRHTDLPGVRFAARAEYATWLDRGLRLFEYQPSVLHSKYAVVDGEWSTVGTFNALSVGMRYAVESNLFVHDAAFAERVAALFARDEGRSSPITHAEMRSRGFAVRVRDAACRAALRLFDRP